jgi:predicted PurR-regulated permease PerM
MSVARQTLWWLAALAVAFLLLWLLSDVLLPFVAGMAVAYFLDPAADRLQRLGLSRAAATSVITVLFFLVVALAAVLLAPVIYHQLLGFLEQVPGYVASLRDALLPLVQKLLSRLPLDGQLDARTALQGYGERALNLAGRVVGGLLGGGLALFNLLALVLITPVVAFYLLIDWDRIVARVDEWLPRQHADTIRAQVREVDRVLAGFVRGQAVVCLSLAVFYAAGLTLVGLDYGLVIGLVTGLLAFIPFVGAGFGLVASTSVALIQFWPDYPMVGAVLAIFAAGQFLEGNLLQPRLVGGRVGLHPVWVIFGLLAGGSLFGFVGVLLAVPAFAVIGVMARFALRQYLASGLYSGAPPRAAPDEPPGPTP